MHELLDSTIVVAILAATVRIATPLLLASIGELVVQRAGIWNLGIEGTMLMAAFAAYMTAIATDSLWAAVLVAVITGLLMNMIMALCATTFKLNQFIVGLGLNLFAAGTTLFLYRQAAVAAGGDTMPALKTFDIVPLPGLSAIPLLAKSCFLSRDSPISLFLWCPWFGGFSTEQPMAWKSAAWAKIQRRST